MRARSAGERDLDVSSGEDAVPVQSSSRLGIVIVTLAGEVGGVAGAIGGRGVSAAV